MKGLYALADCSKSLKGTIQKQLKETTATVIGEITALNTRLSTSDINEKIDGFSRQIGRLEKENRRMKETIDRIQTRDSIRKSTPLPDTMIYEEVPLEQRIPRRTPRSSKDGETLRDKEEGHPSRSFPPIDGKHL